jgi:hypothetical protein
MAKNKLEELEDEGIVSKLMILSNEGFMLKQSKAGYGDFDLYIEKTINKGKVNERVDLVLSASNLPFETCVEKFIHSKLSEKEEPYTIKEYLTKYRDILSNIIKEIVYEDN